MTGVLGIIAVLVILMGVKFVVSKALKLMGFALLLLGLLIAGGAFALLGHK